MDLIRIISSLHKIPINFFPPHSMQLSLFHTNVQSIINVYSANMSVKPAASRSWSRKYEVALKLSIFIGFTAIYIKFINAATSSGILDKHFSTIFFIFQEKRNSFLHSNLLTQKRDLIFKYVCFGWNYYYYRNLQTLCDFRKLRNNTIIEISKYLWF